MAGTRVGAEVWPAAGAGLWNIDATLYYPGHVPATWNFTDIPVDPNKPFDTGLIWDVNIPGADYRRIRLTT